jgi:hypothetical protein
MAAMLDRLRMPLGSIVVDFGLVLTLVFTAGQMTNRFEAMDRRLAAMEQRAQTDRLTERTALLEQRAVQYDRDRTEILDSLRRIELKLDGKADKRQ